MVFLSLGSGRHRRGLLQEGEGEAPGRAGLRPDSPWAPGADALALRASRLGGWVFLTSPSPGRRLGVPAPPPFLTGCAPRRAEPALSRIREDRRRIVLPAIDNIKYDTFEVQQYASAAHGYNWGLWCMYIIPPQDWLDRGDEAAPIR